VLSNYQLLMTRLFRKTVTPLSPTARLERLFGSEADRIAKMEVFPMDGALNALFEISGAVAPRQRLPFVWQGRQFICGRSMAGINSVSLV